jgi:hypothetical protein
MERRKTRKEKRRGENVTKKNPNQTVKSSVYGSVTDISKLEAIRF